MAPIEQLSQRVGHLEHEVEGLSELVRSEVSGLRAELRKLTKAIDSAAQTALNAKNSVSIFWRIIASLGAVIALSAGGYGLYVAETARNNRDATRANCRNINSNRFIMRSILVAFQRDAPADAKKTFDLVLPLTRALPCE